MNNRKKKDAVKDYELFDLALSYQMEARVIVAKTIEKHYPDEKALTALDFCCGSGLLSQLILNNNPHSRITAIDNNPIMLEVARHRLANFSVSFIDKDGPSHLPCLEKRSFDIFVSGFAIHEIAKGRRAEVMKNVYDLLKAGGILLIADKIVTDARYEQLEEWQQQTDDFQQHLKSINRDDLVADWTKHYIHDFHPDRILTSKSLFWMLRQAGFRNISEIFHKNMTRVIYAKK